MRINDKQINAFTKAISPFLEHYEAKLYLFGSRARDDLKGGDIDLLLSVFSPEGTQKIIAEKHIILNQIKKEIGDRKIDLTIANSDDIFADPFLKEAMKNGICLKIWRKT